MPTGIPKSGKRKPRVERISRICEVCGRERFYTPGEIRVREEHLQTKIRFCSKACDSKHKTKPDTFTELTCSTCGQLFKKRTDHVKPSANYCSHGCCQMARRKEDARWRDPEQIKAYMSEYSKSHREDLNRLSREWVQANREKRLQIQADYRETHKDEIVALSHNRRSKKKQGTFTGEDWGLMKQFYNYTCLCCGKSEPEIKLTLDHIQPLAFDGVHELDNIQPLCFSCNSSKGTKTIDYRIFRM